MCSTSAEMVVWRAKRLKLTQDKEYDQSPVLSKEGVTVWPPLRDPSSYSPQARTYTKRKGVRKRRRRRRGGVKGRPWWRHNARASRTQQQYVSSSSYLSNTDSDLSYNMPGGFENSAMKSSFSLSSLQPSSVSLESPEHVRLQDRPYSSLRKKPRKDPDTELWRRSWGSREENKDEFWAALKINYQYLMDSNLIDSCEEVLQCGGSPTHEWSLEQFLEQYTELYTWLTSIHDAIFGKGETVIDRQLRLSYMEEMQRKSYKRKLFNNQSGRVVARNPKLKQEVAWRVELINSKWERLEQTVTPRKRLNAGYLDVCTDVEYELRCLRKWIKETELRLKPLNFQLNWTLLELKEKAREHEVIQRDVWSHGKIVVSVVKLCERLAWAEGTNSESISSWVRGRRYEPSQAVHFARSLERRWQLLYLSSLEWQYRIERLTDKLKHQEVQQSVSVGDSDEEPVTKHPRLSEENTLEDSAGLADVIPVIQEDETDCCLMDTGVLEEAATEMEVETQTCTTERLFCATMETEEQPERILLGQSITPNTVRKLFIDETSKFNRSDRRSQNCATFYFRHTDTETEQEVVNAEAKSMDESSEEEWTYTGADQQPLTEESLQEVPQQESPIPDANSTVPDSNVQDSMVQTEPLSLPDSIDSEVPEVDLLRPRHEVIKRLVNRAEELVREEVASPARKSRVFEPLRFTDPKTNTRIVEWLQLRDPESKTVGDSCDASGEYTTEEDEGEARSDFLGDSQQDLDSTLVASVNTPTTPDQPKVVMRAKKREVNAQRPWSVSVCTNTGGNSDPDLSNLAHSISESAIHQRSQTPNTCGVKVDSSVNTVSTLSSSTVEDTAQTQEGSGGGYSSNSLRRRKIKLRKRNMMRKSESGSEGMIALVHSDSSHPTVTNSPAKLQLVKPFSRRPSADKALNDSPHRRYPTTVLSPTSSETESDEESEDSVKLRKKITPAFIIGPAHTVVLYAERRDKIHISAESSFSEQAWDNYQEKYMSEAYSEEAPDSEAARKLWEFGDDYRNFLDSQSDCASSLGRPPVHRRRRVPRGGGESDSDLEELWHMVRLSHNHLTFSEQVFNSQLLKASPHLVLASDFAEVEATCTNNVKCLNDLLENIEQDTALLSEQECKEIRGLVEKWEALKKGAEDLQRVRSLQREMAALRDELLEIAHRETPIESELDTKNQLELRIQAVKSEVSRLRELKKQLLQVNVAVHRFLTDSKHPSPGPLKDEVAELYRVWDETNHRVSAELSSLQKVGTAWEQFESHLETLEVALRGDQETLRLLDLALQRGGTVSPDLASSVRDLAKVLSEKHDSPTLLTQEETGAGPGTTEGSLSDSGISDSGSEQDLSERERRLADLRRLVRHLEAVLAPGSTAIANMSKRIEQTENELRGLQQTCRDLIVRTAVCAEAKTKTCEAKAQQQKHQQLNSLRRKKCEKEGARKDCSGGGKPNWLWRVMRAALPFQLAIMALLCIACLLEPHCCDSINNLNLSISPQLRYVRGPPPV